MSNEVACQAVTLREGVETSLDTSSYGRSQRFLDFARNDRREDTTQCLFSSLQVNHDEAAYSAATNMAIDEALLEHAAVPSIRFYRWHSPALSFGYFGKFAEVAIYERERDLVRRWTGGGIVFHGDDLTYSIAIPVSDAAFSESSISIYEKIHRALIDALAANGECAELASLAGVTDTGIAITDRGYDCFEKPVRADVMVNGRKVAGAAQRRTRVGLLHQGSLQGVDLGNDLADRFAKGLSNSCNMRNLSAAVYDRAQKIAAQKYGTQSWLRKR
jgi:lipoate-protein ligase A